MAIRFLTLGPDVKRKAKGGLEGNIVLTSSKSTLFSDIENKPFIFACDT
jgi:hypothetical protein